MPNSSDYYLPSPQSYEPIQNLKKNIKKKKTKKRKTLGKYVPFKSIYEQPDISKLTPRQQLMVLRYKNAITNAESDNFIVIENSYQPQTFERKTRLNIKKPTDNTENLNNPNLENPAIPINNNISLENRISPNFEIKKHKCDKKLKMCSKCTKDIKNILIFFKTELAVHECKFKSIIFMEIKKLERILNHKNDFIFFKNETARIIDVISNLQCCSKNK
ncbi:hypothetical protein CWI36_0655p0020 [Hamiltosporidium magnivora]|uniref:Uncharacterized protein n=1 Tax=Hamiltosporidium magnivora TaxID=148818 RepID=A0A4Q9LCW4_9MICR|nr:hypothetical protein CWI36_0655p0020 [Hamiltosporidium magnivora]